MDNYDRNPLWADRYPRWTVGDMRKAIHELCRVCNCEDRWNESNDCVSPACAVFPYRPGEQRGVVLKDGKTYRRAGKSEGRQQAGKRMSANLTRKQTRGLNSARKGAVNR